MVSPSSPPIKFETAIQSIIREEWGYLISTLYKSINDFDLIEDALQDAIETALVKWKQDGLPKSPKGWLLITAKRKAIDKIRRQKNFQSKQTEYGLLLEQDDDVKEYQFDIPDERLRLIFTCCHPALDNHVSTALTLRLLGGLSTMEIARAFLVTKKTMAQRIVRGKRKIKQTAIPYIIPDTDSFQQRLSAVLSVLYLIFNEGYSATSGEKHIRGELCNEAIRLARILNGLCPDEPEVMALLALMLLHDSRKSSRFDSRGGFVSLEDQDRSLWNQNLIREGTKLTEVALGYKKLGPYQIQAAISAVHASARSFEKTDWQEIVLLYDELYNMNKNSVVDLNRIVARANITGVLAEIKALDALESKLQNYQPFYAAKADFLLKLKKTSQAQHYFEKAVELSGNDCEKEFLRNKIMTINHLQRR